MTTPEVRIIVAWHEALNGGDVENLVELSHPEIEVGGPRGTGRGVQLLREWVAQAGIHLEHRRVFHREETVVVEQEAGWRSSETGELSGSQHVASIFVVRDGLVTRVSRYPDLAEAFRAADLDGSHEVQADYRTGTRGSGGEVRKL